MCVLNGAPSEGGAFFYLFAISEITLGERHERRASNMSFETFTLIHGIAFLVISLLMRKFDCGFVFFLFGAMLTLAHFFIKYF